jgi:hypothetical protein
MINETAPTALTLCIFALLFCGLIVLTWGKKLPTKGNWLVWTGLLALLVGVGYDGRFFLKEEFKTKIWMSGWIWSRDEIGAITVGVYQDSLGLAMSALAALVASTLIVNLTALGREKFSERTHAAIAVSTAGVALAWNALTPWLVLTGLVLSIIGGFISMGSRWDSDSESYLAVRFTWERVSGCLLAFVGACILATSRSALLLNNTEAWLAGADSLAPTWVGSLLLVVGLFMQMQPFPFLGLVVIDSEMYSPLRTLLLQIFPAWAAFSLLLRLEPYWITLGLFPGFGWFALGSSVLAVMLGLFQKNWRQGIASWLAAGFSLSCAFLAFSGAAPALGMLLGTSLGALVLSGAATSLEEGIDSDSNEREAKKGPVWIKVIGFLGIAAGTGMLGFVSSNAGILWINQAIQVPGMVAAFLIGLFFFVLLGWKIAWNVAQLRSSADISWTVILSLFFWLFLSLGIVWTGTVTGGALPGDSDQVWTSLFSYFFGTQAAGLTNADDFVTSSSLYWGVLIFAFATAYWTSARSDDRWVRLADVIPRTSRFIAGGYGIDTALSKLNYGIVWVGKFAENLVDEKIWSQWVPNSLAGGIKTVSVWTNRMDTKISVILGVGLRRLVDVPARALQFIQTGDLRWYLFFAVASGFALLLHFMRT